MSGIAYLAELGNQHHIDYIAVLTRFELYMQLAELQSCKVCVADGSGGEEIMYVNTRIILIDSLVLGETH